MNGIGILNVGAGDTKLTFDKSNPAECIRAARIVTDMLRRGYALLIDSGEKDPEGRVIHARVLEFKADTFEYIIADLDPVQAAAADAKEEQHGQSIASEAPAPAAPQVKRGRGRKTVSATSTSGVAVARIAGG